MAIHLDIIQDKVECFEAPNLKTLEAKINEQINNNKALLLEINHVSHQVHIDHKTSRPIYSAIVHFKAKNQ